MANNYFRRLSVINPVAQRALRDPQSMFVHRGVHRSWPSLLKIDFFLFSTRLGDLAFLKLQLFSVWLRRRVFVCIYIIKFVNDRLLCFSQLWAPGPNFCASANPTSTYRKTWVPKTLCCPCSSKSKFSLAYWLTWLHTVKFRKKPLHVRGPFQRSCYCRAKLNWSN